MGSGAFCVRFRERRSTTSRWHLKNAGLYCVRAAPKPRARGAGQRFSMLPGGAAVRAVHEAVPRVVLRRGHRDLHLGLQDPRGRVLVGRPATCPHHHRDGAGAYRRPTLGPRPVGRRRHRAASDLEGQDAAVRRARQLDAGNLLEVLRGAGGTGGRHRHGGHGRPVHGEGHAAWLPPPEGVHVPELRGVRGHADGPGVPAGEGVGTHR